MDGVITLGEALIDFIPVDKKNKLFEKNPGGAPANVAVGLARLGSRTAFIGKVGDDSLGRFLYDTLADEDIILNNMILTKEAKTALTIVTLDEDGDRSFDFFGEESADRLLSKEEVDEEDDSIDLADLEAEIIELETELEEMEEKLNSLDLGQEELVELSQEYQTLKDRLEDYYQLWEEAI